MKNLILKLLVSLIIIACTISVIFYAKGYRINFTDSVVIKTGILHLETSPNRANFWLTEDFTGKTPEIVSSVPAGEYELDIWLDGYHDINYGIEIFAERSTPLSVFLFKKEPEIEIVEEIEEPIIDIHVDNSRNNALVFIEESQDKIQRNYEILKYQTNTRFWQLGSNPSTLFTFSIDIESEIEEILISPNSKNVLLTITNSQKEIVENTKLLPAGKHLISLDTQTVLADITTIQGDVKWSHDGETIVWKDNRGINKLNLKEPDLPILVYTPPKDTNIIYYDSYTNGEIYMLLKTEGNSYVSLSRVSEELEKTFLIEKIYYQEEQRFLENWKEDEKIPYQIFTNSPQSTIFVGEPKEFLISKESQNIIFNTDFASYLYDIQENSYILINPYETEILNFSPDGRKIIFLSLENEKLGFFRIEKEINDYSTKLGGHYVADYITQEDCTDFAWHQNSQNIYYICEGSLYVTDIKANSNINLVQKFGNKILLENRDKVVTFSTQEETLNIVEYTIN
jgi:hypothetical protein